MALQKGGAHGDMLVQSTVGVMLMVFIIALILAGTGVI